MRKIWISVFTIFLITFISCEKDDNDIGITTGLTGNVKYGIGDCMPIIDELSREYKDYKGDIYFIVKTDLENLGNGDFDELKANSIKETIEDGKLDVELPVDTFLVMPSDVYLFSDSNTITIKEGITLEKDFKFWKCTSY
tara:strand:- start:374 stop:793 length:420 start_codon:yes stop_codon:yes gene_type:complete